MVRAVRNREERDERLRALAARKHAGLADDLAAIVYVVSHQKVERRALSLHTALLPFIRHLLERRQA